MNFVSIAKASVLIVSISLSAVGLAQSFVTSGSPIESNGQGPLSNAKDWQIQSTIHIDTPNSKLGWSAQITGGKLTQNVTQTYTLSVVQPFPLLPIKVVDTLSLTYTTRGASVQVNYDTGSQTPVFDSTYGIWTVAHPVTRIEVPASVSYTLYESGTFVQSGTLDYSVAFTIDPIRGINTANYPTSVTASYQPAPLLYPTRNGTLATIVAPSGAVIGIPAGAFNFVPEPLDYTLATTGLLALFALIRRNSAMHRTVSHQCGPRG